MSTSPQPTLSSLTSLTSVPGVVSVELLRGARASADTPPSLLVEVPHGADEPRHYDALRGRLRGALPEGLELFFNVNTDLGAWTYGRLCMLELLRRFPERCAQLLRCELPRTFIDCNRVANYGGGELKAGALTPGIPPYVRDEHDRSLLAELHAGYVEVAERAYARVCGGGGLALIPHSYGPRSLGIERVDDQIVEKLRWACAPERHDSWPLRAEVDLLTRDAKGKLYAPEGLEQRLRDSFRAAGFGVEVNGVYHLHPSTQGYEWCARYPGQVLTLELRRDLLVEAWTPFEPMHVVSSKCERVAQILAGALALAAPESPSPRSC